MTYEDLASRLEALARAVSGLVFGEGPEGARWTDQKDRLSRTLRSYLATRARNPNAPLLVVFAGPTGAGKSTLLNSIAGVDFTVTGPLRPTTSVPVVLAEKARGDSYRTIGGVECEVITRRARILGEMTLVDTPDIDSTSVANRAVAETMIDHADVVVFISSALRYADLVPWEVLRRAESRGAPVIHVLNRLSSNSAGALTDYVARLDAEGLGDEVVAVHEHYLAPGVSSVPLQAIQGLRRRLEAVVQAHHDEVTQNFRLVLDATLRQVGELADVAEKDANEAEELRRRIRSGLHFDLEAILAGVDLSALRPLNLDDLLARRKPSRAKMERWLRRRGPTPDDVARVRGQLMQSLVLSTTTQLRRSIARAGEPVDGVGVFRLSAEQGRILYDVVDDWAAGWLAKRGGPLQTSHDLGTLLLLVSVLGDEEGSSSARGILGLLTDDADSLAEEGRRRLATAIGTAYAAVERDVVFGLGSAVSSRASIDKARGAMSEVIARSTFANA